MPQRTVAFTPPDNPEKESTTVEYDVVERDNKGQARKRVVHVTVENLQGPELEINPKRMALRRLTHLHPQPTDTAWNVVWNGDTETPLLRFDGWPTKRLVVVLEAWGR